MSGIPPPYANYPRNTVVPRGGSNLRNLSEGYYGLSGVFAINAVLFVLSAVPAMFMPWQSIPRIFFSLSIIVTGLAIARISYPHNRKIAEGAGWPSYRAILASLFIGLNSMVCCGIVGYAVMQQIAINNMKRYGIRPRLFGLKKAEIQAAIDELDLQETNPSIERFKP